MVPFQKAQLCSEHKAENTSPSNRTEFQVVKMYIIPETEALPLHEEVEIEVPPIFETVLVKG